MRSEEYVMMSRWLMDIAVRLRDEAVAVKDTTDARWDKIYSFQRLAMNTAKCAFAGDTYGRI